MQEGVRQPTLAERYEPGLFRFQDRLLAARREALKPPPILTLSQWANEYAHLSPETSAETGKFRAFGYQNGIMDAITDPRVETVTVMKSARVGYTKVLDNVAGFFIHQDPSPILIVQPRVEDAEDYSRTEIAPMLRDTPVLAEIAGDLKSRDSSQRILKRVFRNGSSISFVGANSPGGFRRITARVILFDEVDGYPPQGAGVEGDQISLGTKRSESFWNRKIVLGSTPTVKVTSRILRSWNESDQRRYHVPCPHCGERQALKWSGIRWENGDQTTAHYVCEINGCIIDEADKPGMIAAGEWVAKKPFTGHAGFHIWAGYSLFPNASWPKLVAEFLRVKNDPALLKTFVNLVLGEAWEDDGETVEGHALSSRCEDWADGAVDEGTGERNPAPRGVLIVTCGVDVQGDRLEVERVGWGLNDESWSLDHHVIYGDPSAPEVWRDLDDYLQTMTLTADSRDLPVSAACVDYGGHYGQAVADFVRDKGRRRIWGIRGQGGAGKPVWPKLASKKNKGRIALFHVGVDQAKDIVYARLRIQVAGPGYCHFPKGRDAEWFEQLTSEIVVTKHRKGFPVREWTPKPSTRQEALDCRVYAFAALRSMSINWGKVQRRLADQTSGSDAPAPPPQSAGLLEAQHVPAPAGKLSQPRRRKMVRTSFMAR